MTKEEEKYTTLDTEQCKWWINHLFSMAKEQACNSHNFNDAEEMQAAQDKIIKALEQEPKIVPIAVIKFDEDKLKELVNNAVLTVTSQEPVIDKIRAEILEDCGYSKDYVGAFTYSTIKVANVLQILDKYKVESGDNNEL